MNKVLNTHFFAYRLLAAFGLLAVSTFANAQTTITPIRTDVSGFATWTDALITGTTYLQLKSATSKTTTPTMDFTPYSSVALDFKIRSFGGVNTAKNTITISVSTNGSTWTAVTTKIPTSATLTAVASIDLSSYTSSSTVMIRFESLGADGSIGAGIDDIDIKGVSGAPVSSTSDVITLGNEALTVSSLTNGTIASATGGTEVWQFQIRDGGASAPDVDALPTIMTGLKISKNTSSAAVFDAIQDAVLIDLSTSAIIAHATAITTTIDFTGLSVSCADDATKNLALRITLKCPLPASSVDGDDFVFTITNANFTTASATTSSQKASFTAAASLDAKNVITVVATQLTFTTQPTNTAKNGIMGSVAVSAKDACGNLDKGFTGSVSLASSGTMTGAPLTATAVAGVATFTNIVHTALGTGLTLTASSGAMTANSTTFNIINATVFSPGDFAVVAFNTQAATGSFDEICFITFVDITPGTSFDITDNGYERVTANKWGDTEGTLRFTLKTTSAMIPAGTAICIDGPDAGTYTVYYCGTDHSADFTMTNLNGLNVFDFNNSDQVWFMAGGTWTNPAGSHDATYTGGAYLYGFTATGWKTAPNYASTSGSTMLPPMQCFNTDVNGKVNKDKVKYTGPITATTKYSWISRINNSANWTDYTTNALYDGAPAAYDYYFGCVTFPISPQTEVDGQWKGTKDVNWFDCANWDTRKVPDLNTDVIISTTATNTCDIDNTAAHSDLFSDVATCRNLTIENSISLNVNDNLDYLRIFGDITINNNALFNLGTAIDGGNVFLKGNWTNNRGAAGLQAGHSTVTLNGAATQTLNTAGTQETFYNLAIDKTAGSLLDINKNVTVDNNLTFATGGIIKTNANRLFTTKTATNSIAGYTSSGSTDKYIQGNLRRNVLGATLYDFPVGDATHGCQMAKLNFTTIGAATYGEINYTNAGSGAYSQNIPCDVDGDGDTDLVKYDQITGTWNISSDATNGAFTSNVTLLPSGSNPYSAAVVDNMRHNGVNILACGNTGFPQSGNTSQSVTSFSPFQIISGNITLPVKLLSLSAKTVAKAISVEWTTASEQNNKQFDIERSTDGVNFYKIGEVGGNGTTNTVHKYVFLDTKAQNGTNYYRLRQVDFDGKTSVSHIVSAQIKPSSHIVINGNPVHNDLNITITTTEQATATLLILSTDGKTVYTETLNLQNGINTYPINTSNFAAGVYILHLKNGANAITQRFVKQ